MDPKEIISDEESAALREAPPADGPAPAGQVQDLHADHWERVLADRAPALESIAERMVSLLKLTARRFLRAGVEVAAHPVRSVRWGTYARQLPAPASLNLLEIRPAGLKGMIVFDAGFVFTLVDIFFGGDGQAARPEDMIEFTPMEQRLTRKFVEALGADLKQAWKPFLDLEFVPGKMETNPIFAALAASSEFVSVARFALVVGAREHGFDVVLPASLVEPLRAMRGAGPPEAAGGNAQAWRSRLRQDVQGARVSMRAVLAGTRINLRDIAMARPGDVIYTEIPTNVVLYAGEQPLLEGSLGVSRGRNAVRISKAVNQRILGEKHGRN